MADMARAAGMRITIVTIPLACHSFDGIAGSLGSQATHSIASSFLKTRALDP